MQVCTKALNPPVFQKHLIARAHAKKKGKRLIVASLSLTSMVDMFSLLVIFLLQAFSAAPDLLPMTKGVELPTARSGAEIVDAPVLSVSSREIYLDQKLVGTVDDVLKDPEPLMSRLSELRELWQRTHPNGKFKGEINIQAHRGAPSTVISQLMGMLPSQHYGALQLVVVSGGK